MRSTIPPKNGARSTQSNLKPAATEKTRAIGFNTDADAITQSLREDLKLELRGAKVLLLGAGGAGRTAALKLASENVAELFLVNRTPSRSEEIAGEIKKQFPSVKAAVGFPPATWI